MRRSINSQDIHLLFNEFRKHFCPWTDIGEIRSVALFRDGLEALVMYGSDSCSLAPIRYVN
jgi:hypothetical protein